MEKRQPNKAALDTLEKELSQLEESIRASLKELIAKALLSPSEECILATPVEPQEKSQG